jgi:hypothetical protein
MGDAQVILLAVQLASDTELERLHQLAARRPDVITASVLYRVLLSCLPVDAPLPQLIQLLRSLHSHSLEPESYDTPIDLSLMQDLSASDVKRRISSLRFVKAPQVSANPLTCFLVARALQIEAENRDLLFILHLMEPFIDQDEYLRSWVCSRLLPLLRLQYEYYPGEGEFPTLHDMEQIQGSSGVRRLLRYTSSANPARDIRGVVAPWIYGDNAAKRRKTHGGYNSRSTGWADVNEWILDSSVHDLLLASTAVSEWDGPRDIDLGGYDGDKSEYNSSDDEEDQRRYQQTALAIIYASEDTTQDSIATSVIVLERAANLADLLPPDRSKAMPLLEELPPELASVTRVSLLHSELLKPDNVLTRPSSSAVSFAEALLASVSLLKVFKVDMSVRAAAELCLHGSEEQQRRELHRVLQQIPRMTNTNIDWRSVQSRLLYLGSWTGSHEDHTAPHGLLWKVQTSVIHEELFKTMLVANEHSTAIEMFFQADQELLPTSRLEECVKVAIFSAYDNASNGNRTRGGLKRAYDLLKAFQPHFPDSDLFRQVDHLIAATHALSYYQLTLQHGIPFQPVSIRVHKDPLSLIDKVLMQNPRAYTKVDDLQGIGMNIVLAGLPATSDADDMHKSIQVRLAEAEQRVNFAAISSALAQHDFDTAYSYITTHISQQSSGTVSDDTSWRAVYAAGKYQPPSTPQSSVSRMASLSKRMDLLSLALTLCSSPDHLPEILDVWRKCEEQMDSLRAKEADEERVWEEKSDAFSPTSIPGDFGEFEDREVDIADTKRAIASRSGTVRSSVGYEDEAPMGLFDVARSAAAAIQKSAFPLRAGAQRQASTASAVHRSQSSMVNERPGSALSGGAERVRRRDMVSNAVTGGLLKGMSWALGAEPVPTKHDEEY